MSSNDGTHTKKNKAPAIVTWLSVALATVIALAKVGQSGVTGGAAFSSFAAAFFVHFLVIYFVLWLTAKIVRKIVGADKKTAVNISTMIAAVLLFFVFGAMYMTTEADSESGLYTCASDSAIEGIRSTLEDNASNDTKIEVLDLSDLQELSISEDGTKRTCIGEIVLNTGRGYIKYIFSFAKSDPAQVLIEIEEVDEDLYRRLRGYAEQHSKESSFKAQMDAHEASGQ